MMPDPHPDYPPPVLTKRECLKCGKAFNSTGPGNRICYECNVQNSRMAGNSSVVGTGKYQNSKPFSVGDKV